MHDWRIGIDDGFSMSRPTGIGRHTSSLMSALAAHAPQATVHHIRHAPLDRVRPRALRRALYLAWLASGVPSYRQRRTLDLVHFTNYHVAPRKPRGLRYAVTIHDLVPFRVPETKSVEYTAYLRRAIAQALRVADVVFAVSQSVRDEIADVFGVSPAGIRVVYVAPTMPKLDARVANEHLRRIQPEVGGRPFVLFVGALERRKNLVELVRAFRLLPPSLADVQLLLAGRPGPGYGSIQEAIAAANQDRRIVHVLTTCSDFDLRALYATCAAFAFPSLYEGYGIPLLEAMQGGAPIVASDIPTNRELAGDAAVIVPPSADGLAEGLARVFDSDSLRRELVRQGRTRAAAFSPEITARQLLEGYGGVLP